MLPPETLRSGALAQAVPVSAAISRASAAKGSIPQAAEVIACASGNCESRSP